MDRCLFLCRKWVIQNSFCAADEYRNCLLNQVVSTIFNATATSSQWSSLWASRELPMSWQWLMCSTQQKNRPKNPNFPAKLKFHTFCFASYYSNYFPCFLCDWNNKSIQSTYLNIFTVGINIHRRYFFWLVRSALLPKNWFVTTFQRRRNFLNTGNVQRFSLFYGRN